jgi:hypothetical protein
METDKLTPGKEIGFLRDNVGAKSSKVDKNNALNFGNDPDRPQPHAEGKLSSYHVEFQKKANPHLQVLLNALVDDPSFSTKPQHRQSKMLCPSWRKSTALSERKIQNTVRIQTWALFDTVICSQSGDQFL